MGEWTWLFQVFPLADVDLVSDPVRPEVANVLVRTVRQVPGSENEFEVRVAPHNVAPFRGGPWIQRFARHELDNPGPALAAFRRYIASQVAKDTGDR